MASKFKSWTLSDALYQQRYLSNNIDFSVVISMNWPNFSTRVEDRSEEET